MIEEVLIEFITDYSSLDKAIDVLEKAGKVDTGVANAFKATNLEINKQAQAIRNTAAAYKGPLASIDQLDKKSRQFVKDFTEGLQEGINEELRRAKPEIDAFRKKLEEAGKSGTIATGSLRQELRKLTEQIAAAKASGGPVDPEMIKRAGNLKDAISDASKEIANAGSDTRGIDNVVGSISALAGGFAAVQGAVGLFSKDNEELQKILLKVNSAMALATGIQQVANAVQKEGALTKLADVLATKAQIVAHTAFNFVVGTSTGLLKAFRIALALTGIGLLVIGVLALVNALKSENKELETTNSLLDHQKNIIEGLNEVIDQRINLEEARARRAGEAESELIRIQGRGLIARREGLVETQRILALEREAVEGGSEAWFKLNEQIEANNTALRGINNKIIETSINLETQLADEQKDAAEKRKQLAEKSLQDAKARNEKELQAAREARAAEFEEFKAGEELKVLAAAEGSEEQVEARKKVLKAELLINLENEKLTNNQRKVLIQQFFKDRLQLEKDFGKVRNEQALSEIASDLNSELQQINISNDRRLELTESLLDVQAGLEIAAAQGNAAKIQEINAKKDRAILELRKSYIQAAADFEASLVQATGGRAQRALQRVADDEKQKLNVRINAINQLEQIELLSLDKRSKTNKKLLAAKVITQQEFDLAEAQLLDEKNKVWENSEKKREDVTIATNERIRQSNIKTAEDIVAVFSGLVDVLDSLFSLQGERENQQLEEQKRLLQDLRDSGAITEKEAILRAKRLEAEERKIKNKQAQRDKQIAVFNALIAIPQAFLAGIKSAPPPLGPILGAINAAIAAAQAAIIIARPVPKFAKGKKDKYEGPGIMGEKGAEIIQRSDGSMHIASKPTLVYVGSKDRIYTHTETKSMIPFVDRAIMKPKEAEKINYDKLAQAIIKGYKPSPGPSILIDKEFISESVYDGLMKTNYFDRYYSSK